METPMSMSHICQNFLKRTEPQILHIWKLLLVHNTTTVIQTTHGTHKALVFTKQLIYGINSNEWYIYRHTIYRARLDGTGMAEIHSTYSISIVSLALYDRTVYFTGITNETSQLGGIYSIDLDSASDFPTVIQEAMNPYGIAVYGR